VEARFWKTWKSTLSRQRWKSASVKTAEERLSERREEHAFYTTVEARLSRRPWKSTLSAPPWKSGPSGPRSRRNTLRAFRPCFFAFITLVCGRGIFRLATCSPRYLMIRGWMLVHWIALRPVYQRNS